MGQESIAYEKTVAEIVSKLTNYSQLREDGKVGWGNTNKWIGASGFRHQIDVSLSDGKHILLVECKRWDKAGPVKAIPVLAHWGRVLDIQHRPENSDKEIRGAIVSLRGFELGAKRIARHYNRDLSLFEVTDTGQCALVLHTHFIELPSIGPTSVLFPPSVSNQ